MLGADHEGFRPTRPVGEHVAPAQVEQFAPAQTRVERGDDERLQVGRSVAEQSALFVGLQSPLTGGLRGELDDRTAVPQERALVLVVAALDAPVEQAT